MGKPFLILLQAFWVVAAMCLAQVRSRARVVLSGSHCCYNLAENTLSYDGTSL